MSSGAGSAVQPPVFDDKVPEKLPPRARPRRNAQLNCFGCRGGLVHDCKFDTASDPTRETSDDELWDVGDNNIEESSDEDEIIMGVSSYSGKEPSPIIINDDNSCDGNAAGVRKER